MTDGKAFSIEFKAKDDVNCRWRIAVRPLNDANLFKLDAKYADAVSSEDTLNYLLGLWTN